MFQRKGLVTSVLLGLVSFLYGTLAFAADGGAADKGMYAIAAALAIGIAAAGGALGQGRAAAAALEGIARNPGAANKVMTPMIIALALMESLVIFALIIAFTVAP